MSTTSYFLIRSKLSGLVLDIPNQPGQNVVIMYSANNGPNQQWTINEQGVIQSKLNSLTLEGQKLYELVVVNPATGTPAQQWIFTEQGLILNKKNSLALEILGQSKDVFVPVVLAPIEDSHLGQQWELVPVQESAPPPVAAPATPPPVAAPPVSTLNSMINFFAGKSFEISAANSLNVTTSPFSTPPDTRQISFSKGHDRNFIHLSFHSAFKFFEMDLISQDCYITPGKSLRWQITYNLDARLHSVGVIPTASPLHQVPQFNEQVMICLMRIYYPPAGTVSVIEYKVGDDFLTLSANRYPHPTSITMKLSPDQKTSLINLINQ